MNKPKSYVKHLMSIEDVVSTIRNEGKSVTLWRLCDWLERRGVTRSRSETIIAQRASGRRDNTCAIPGCERSCVGCYKHCATCIPNGTAWQTWNRHNFRA